MRSQRTLNGQGTYNQDPPWMRKGGSISKNRLLRLIERIEGAFYRPNQRRGLGDGRIGCDPIVDPSMVAPGTQESAGIQGTEYLACMRFRELQGRGNIRHGLVRILEEVLENAQSFQVCQCPAGTPKGRLEPVPGRISPRFHAHTL